MLSFPLDSYACQFRVVKTNRLALLCFESPSSSAADSMRVWRDFSFAILVNKGLWVVIGNDVNRTVQSQQPIALSQSNILRRQLHPLLKELGLNECGFHAFRRFRTTHLRKQRTPEGLVQFWLGHAGKTITDGYDRVREDVVYRKEVAAAVGTGFTVPTVVVQNQLKVQKMLSQLKNKNWSQRFDSEGLKWCARRDSNSRPSGS